MTASWTHIVYVVGLGTHGLVMAEIIKYAHRMMGESLQSALCDGHCVMGFDKIRLSGIDTGLCLTHGNDVAGAYF